MRRNTVLSRAKLNYLVLQHCIADFMSSHFSKAINSCDFCILNVKLDLYMTAIEVLTFGSCLWSTDDLQSVPHIRRDEQIGRVNLEHREHFHADHL